eukprot:gene24479-10087_t
MHLSADLWPLISPRHMISGPILSKDPSSSHVTKSPAPQTLTPDEGLITCKVVDNSSNRYISDKALAHLVVQTQVFLHRVRHISQARTKRIVRKHSLPSRESTPPGHATLRGQVVAGSSKKDIWVECKEKTTLTGSLEAGVSTFLFHNDKEGEEKMVEWSSLARFDAKQLKDDGIIVGQLFTITCPEDLKVLELKIKNSTVSGVVIMDASAWKIIPAENLVALAQSSSTCRLFAVATSSAEAKVMLGALEIGTDGVLLRTESAAEVNRSSAEAKVMLGALEIGTDGVLLRTESAAEVRSVMKYIGAQNQDSIPKLKYDTAVVTRVEPVTATGDRVCVDMATNMVP